MTLFLEKPALQGGAASGGSKTSPKITLFLEKPALQGGAASSGSETPQNDPDTKVLPALMWEGHLLPWYGVAQVRMLP